MFRALVLGSAAAAAAASLAWLVSGLLTDKPKAKLTNVERTAVGVCMGRKMASEQIRKMEGELWDESYDKAIVQRVVSKEDEKEWALRFKSAGDDQEISWDFFVAARTACIDKTVLAFVRGQDVRQVVIIGAGLDCRAWRLPWPEGVTVWEVDCGSVESLKVRALKGMRMRASRRVFVKQDLGSHGLSEALSTAGYDMGKMTLWIAEGLIGYLEVEAGNKLMRDMLCLCPRGSGLIMTCPPNAAERDAGAARGRPLHHVTFQEAEEAVERLKEAGWSVHLRSGDSIAAEYGIPSGRRVQSIMIADKLD